jgi:ribonuclease P protein component
MRLERLLKRPDFLRVAANRNKWAAAGLIMQAAPMPVADQPINADARLGFTVSKKVGNAVQRNRAKRRLRAAAQAVMPSLAAPGFDYVLIGRQQTLARPYSLLLKDLETALKRLRVLRPHDGDAGPDAS